MKFKLIRYFVSCVLLIIASNAIAATVWLKNDSHNAKVAIYHLRCTSNPSCTFGESTYVNPGNIGHWGWGIPSFSTALTLAKVKYKVQDQYFRLECKIVGDSVTLNPTIIFKKNGDSYSCTAYNGQ